MAALKYANFALFCLATVTAIACITRLPCKFYGNFEVFLEDMKDAGAVGKSVTSETKRECALECMSWPPCRSLNFKKGTRSCDLLDRNLTESATHLVQENGVVYMTTDEGKLNQGVTCETLMPCQNGGGCKDACNSHGYICTCAPPYSGSNCEIVQGPMVVFQRRTNPDVDFYQNWASYKTGFGSQSGSFWLGLDELHQLAKPGAGSKLRVVLRIATGTTYVAEYTKFEVENEAAGYRLTISGYSGNASDSLAYHNGYRWSTFDRDNDAYSGNCAIKYEGAWWYNSCYYSNLNGILARAGETISSKNCRWGGISGIIVFSEMTVIEARF